MKITLWFIKRLLAVAIGFTGACAALYICFSQGDTGGAVAVALGTGLACSIMVNE